MLLLPLSYSVSIHVPDYACVCLCVCARARAHLPSLLCLCLCVTLPPTATCMCCLHRLSWAPLGSCSLHRCLALQTGLVGFLQSSRAPLACIASSSPCILSVFPLFHKDRKTKGHPDRWFRVLIMGVPLGETSSRTPWYFSQ